MRATANDSQFKVAEGLPLIRSLRLIFFRPPADRYPNSASRSKNSGNVLLTHAGSRITTPSSLKPASAKLIAMR
jgi:hypothetical protein